MHLEQLRHISLIPQFLQRVGIIQEIVEMAKAVARMQIYIECTSCRTSGVPGVSRYTTAKNRRNTPDRVELKKYCPFERKRTVHREVK